MSLSRAEVEHIAELAKLQLTNEELEQYRVQLSAILEYAQSLNQLDTTAISPTASVLPLRSVMAEDVVKHEDILDRATLLSNAPDTEAGQFRVQAILD